VKAKDCLAETTKNKSVEEVAHIFLGLGDEQMDDILDAQ